MNEATEMSGPELYAALQQMAMTLMAQGAEPSGIAWTMLVQGVQAAAQMDIPEDEVRKLLDQAIASAYRLQAPDPSIAA
ncbi:MAG: hypothetical protein QG599_2823 [Pseudomonadota bacterium]|nr:hypothetical protein [Pseudomonadota bacterium]